MEQTQYKVDGGGWRHGANVLIAAPSDGSKDGLHTIQYRSLDRLLNIEEARTVEVRIDTQAPQTIDNSDGLRHRSFRLEFTAADPPPALLPLAATSGVAFTEYRIDGHAWKIGSAVPLRLAVHRKPGSLARGVHTVQYRSTDAAGNVESIRSCTVRLG